MKKRYLLIGIAALAAGAIAGGGLFQPQEANAQSRDELVQEVETLKAMVRQLGKRLELAEDKLAEGDGAKQTEQMEDMEDSIDDLDKRVGAVERHTVMDRLTFSVDLRSEGTSLDYRDARVMPDWTQSMLSLWAFNKLAVPFSEVNPNLSNMVTPDQVPDFTFNPVFAQKYRNELMGMMPAMLQNGFLSGFYVPSANMYMPASAALAAMGAGASLPADAMPVIATNALGQPLFGSQFTGSDMEMYQGMFNQINPQEQDIENDFIFTTRMRLDMMADPHPNLAFAGRLTANKVWGDSTGVKWFDGDFSSVALDGNVSQKGSDSVVRMERGYATYRDDWGDTHWHLSIGRRPAVDGAPWEISAHNNVLASPLSHAINWQFDGGSLGFDLSSVTGIKGFNFKVCYGQGFESGSGGGNSYSMSYDSDVDDVSFLGYIWRLYDDGTTKFLNMYAHAFDVSDSFTGIVAMPFSLAGVDADGDNLYDAYFIDANRGGYISRMEPFTNVGSMELLNFLFQTKYQETDMFLSLAYNYANPSRVSSNPVLQFWNKGNMMNGNDSQESHDGYSIWAGVKTPVPWTKGYLGFEYNWGSRYWFGFNGAEDTLNGSKLATRGSVYEVYYHQPMLENKLLLSFGTQYFDYKYTGSGNPMGEPKRIEEATALDALMPIADKLWSIYANVSYRW